MRPVTPLSLSLSFSLLSACVFIPRYYNIDTISAAGWRASLIPPRAHPDAVLCVKRRPDYGRASFITLLHSTALPPEREEQAEGIYTINQYNTKGEGAIVIRPFYSNGHLFGWMCVCTNQLLFFLKKNNHFNKQKRCLHYLPPKEYNGVAAGIAGAVVSLTPKTVR